MATCGRPRMTFPHCFLFIFVGPSCRHIKKGTDQTLLKKLSGNSDWTSCQDCKHEEHKENISTTLPQDTEEEQETAAVWMCLKCGHRVSLFNPFIIQILTVYEGTFAKWPDASFLPGMWTKLWEPACHQTLSDSSVRSTLPGGQFGQLECVVSMLLCCVSHRCQTCVWNVKVLVLFWCVAKLAGVTYVMTKSSTLGLDIWLSWWPT